jgi:outer membrane protein OmpA-like peptidoglycan-associated protein
MYHTGLFGCKVGQSCGTVNCKHMAGLPRLVTRQRVFAGDPAGGIDNVRKGTIPMFRLTSTSAAVAVAILIAGGPQPVLAQDESAGAMFGAGPDRVCNVLTEKDGDPVMQKTDEEAVYTKGTFDCPEPEVVAEVAVIEPAAPPQALPERGVVYFDFDRAELNPSAENTMQSIISDIQDRELGGITVAGHTDTAGPPDYNMQLSQRRANTVAAELIKSGIPARIVTTEAFGETDLAVQTPDNTPAQPNRRATVDFRR